MPRGLTDFERGERLVVRIYEALRNRRDLFDKTVLIITYDEHGGFYDHVSPPSKAVAPTPMRQPRRRSVWPMIVGWFVEQPTSRFKFNVLGPRVPTVVVSPLVARSVDATVYDHSAIAATVRRVFAPNTRELSRREAKSATLEHLWGSGVVRDDLPDCSAIYPPRVAAAPTVSAPEPQQRDDEFADQMRSLAGFLGPKLQVQASPDERPMAPAIVEWSPEAVARLLTVAADRARGDL